MSPKQPSKQKRAAQNRAQRAAREARKAAARTPTGSGASAGGARRSGGLLSRLRGGSGGSTQTAASSGRRPTLAEARAMQPPGYRAALSAVFAAVAAIVLCSFLLRYPVDGQGDLYTSETLAADWVTTALDAAQADPALDAAALADSIEEWTPDRADKTVVAALWPWSIAIVLPLIGAGIAFWAVRRRSPSKVLNRALYATLFGAVLTQGLLLLFIPVVLAVGVAMFQVRKAEAQALAASAGEGVIDVAGEEHVDEDGQDHEPDDEPYGAEGAGRGDEVTGRGPERGDEVDAGAGDVEVIEAVTIERAEPDPDAETDRR